MSCYHPHYALDLGINPDTGKHKIKFLAKRADNNLQELRRKYGEDSVLCLPCGHCVGCCLDYAREWAVRCSCEAMTTKEDQSWFITLTYNDDFVPDKLTKEPFRKFIKDLRNKGYKIRFFGCGEYGSDEKTRRPHYHIIVYGLPLFDLKLWKKSPTGYLFTSKLISELWPFGFSTVAHASYETAGYIARYCLKKRMVKNEDEFILMSKHPGIGEKFFKDNCDDIVAYDRIVGSFGKSYYSRVPRYFDKLSEKLGLNILVNKNKRLDLSKKLTRNDLINFCYSHEEQVNNFKEDVKSTKLRFLPRGLL